MKKIMYSSFLLLAFFGIPVFADTSGCAYDDGTMAGVGNIAIEGSICKADGTRKYLEISYITPDAYSRYQKWLLLGDKNNYKKAIEYILKAKKEYNGKEIKSDEKNGLINILLDLSYYYIKDAQYQNALVTANKILRMNVDYRPQSKSIALNNKWAALDNLGDPKKGQWYYQKALDLDYGFETASSNLTYANEVMEAVKWMHENNLTKFTDGKSFSIYDPIKKQHAEKYLVDFTKIILKNTSPKKIFIGKYNSKSELSNEAAVVGIMKLFVAIQEDYYATAQEKGRLMSLDADNYLNKDEKISRGDFAIILYRIANYYANK